MKSGSRLLFALMMVSACLTGLAAAKAKDGADPSSAALISEDIPRFWQAFDASEKEGAEAFQRLYIDKGTPGLQDFMKGRIVSARNLYDTVTKHRKYYESLRGISMDVTRYSKAIHASFYALKYLYPDARFPGVYFVIGALNSAGTSSGNGLIIGLDMYGRTPAMPTEELDDWLRDVVARMDDLPYIVAHELIHFQQETPSDGSLLFASVHEGSADFLGELISGRHINTLAHEYGSSHESELWEEFKTRMGGEDLKGWLYSDAPGRPHDLGYYIGYRIAESFWNKSPDKVKAVHDILAAPDVKGFLEKSGYAPH